MRYDEVDAELQDISGYRYTSLLRWSPTYGGSSSHGIPCVRLASVEVSSLGPHRSVHPPSNDVATVVCFPNTPISLGKCLRLSRLRIPFARCSDNRQGVELAPSITRVGKSVLQWPVEVSFGSWTPPERKVSLLRNNPTRDSSGPICAILGWHCGLSSSSQNQPTCLIH